MSKRKKRPTANPAHRGTSFAGRIVLREFEAWLDETEAPDDLRAHIPARLEELLTVTGAQGIDVLEPDGVAEAIDLLLESDEIDDDEEAFGVLDVLDLYLHFRLGTAGDTSEWERLHDLLEEALAETSDPEAVAETLVDAIAASDAIPEQQRRRALADLPLITAVGSLLDWIGSSRRITDTGALRRADIAPVAQMLGGARCRRGRALGRRRRRL